MPKRTFEEYDHEGKTSPEYSSGIPGESSQRHRRPRIDDTPSSTLGQSSAIVLELDYPDNSKPITKQTLFQQPFQLLSFSYTPDHTLEFTDSALRYFVQPPRNANLKYGYERWKRKAEERGRIDNLLRAVSRTKIMPGVRLQLSDMGVVGWRGVITKILTAPYEQYDGWELNVMSVRGTLYFEEHLSEARLKEKDNLPPRQLIQTYYGYAFESYCTSESPTRQLAPDPSDPVGWGGDVNTNVQWCSVVRTKLGNTRMVIGGEVDCVREKYTRQPDTFVELKTSLAITGPRDEEKFEKKLLKFYFQSFLLGVPEIVVGFRTPSGVVTTTQSFKTIELPRLVRGKPGAWDPLLSLAWGDQMISFLKDVLRREASQDASVWRVKFTPRKGITVRILDAVETGDVTGGEDRVGFLPTWYWDELDAKSGKEEPLTEDAENTATFDTSRANTSKVDVLGWQI